jgi:hypothetical protein
MTRQRMNILPVCVPFEDTMERSSGTRALQAMVGMVRIYGRTRTMISITIIVVPSL